MAAIIIEVYTTVFAHPMTEYGGLTLHGYDLHTGPYTAYSVLNIQHIFLKPFDQDYKKLN